MIDKWFKEDLKLIFDQHSIAVFVDESGDAEFLLKCVENLYTIHRTSSELDELYIKYLIEKASPSQKKFIIYTRSNKEELKFIREYCETNGCLEIRYFQNYIKDKVHRNLNLNINLSKEELIAAAKVSIGKDQNYWMDLCHKGGTEIFDLKKELLSFVHDPASYSKEKYDAQLREILYKKIHDLLGWKYLKKPAPTLAKEIAEELLSGLENNCCNKILEATYKEWLDSVTYRESFDNYLNRHKLSPKLDVWNVNINHPFRQVDESWLAEIGKNISDKKYISERLTNFLKPRNKSKQAQSIGISFWADVIALLEFDQKDILYLSSFDECVDFYKKHFCKLDTAIRNLYTEFLNKKKLLATFQELYKEYVSVFLDKWFQFFSSYQENQTGTLQRIINESNGSKTAVIVGDGVTYEIAEQVALKVKSKAKLKKDSILADIPSETENNMSRIYMDNGEIEAIQSKREAYLESQNLDITIDFIQLNEVTEETLPGQLLICTYKDIDDIGEKLQQKALKYFPETIEFFADKINLLLNNAYTKVYLISDHGFVLTGLLSEADKISVSLTGKHDKAERYIRSVKKPAGSKPGLFVTEKKYGEFEYLYFAKSINPFKTPGVYGFSHGGISPQELVTPYFCWDRSEVSEILLSVTIANKEELKDVTGELFAIKLKADKGDGDLFSQERKVYLVFFANKELVNKSDIFTIQQNEQISKEYLFDGHPEIEVQLLDATSQQLLDRAVVKQNKDRDLGGLF